MLGSAAACGGTHHEPPRSLGPAPTLHREPPAPAPTTRVRLVVTVVDGDRSSRVRRAVVRLWGQAARTDATGVAEIVVPRRRPLHVTVGAHGYGTRTVYEDFTGSRKVTIRIYRPELQWPIYGATPERAQSQSHIRLRPPFRTVWSRGMGSLIEFPAVVDDGVAYIGNAEATIRAVSMREGTVLWRHDTPYGKMASSPAVVGDELVYHTMDGHVYVLDRADGRLRWRYDVGSPVESSPIVRDGIDYFGAWNGVVYALDLRTHRLRWTRALGAKITSSAALAGGRLFIGDYGGRLWALAPRSGATRWVGAVNGRIYGTPAVAGGRVFVPSSTGGSLTAFSETGRYLWRVGTGSYVYSSPAAWGGRVFFGSYNGLLYAVSARTGGIRWAVGTGGPISGAAVVVDGVAYAGSFAHRIVGVDARSGRVVLRFGHGHYVPVSGNGQRLLFHGYSRLYAVEPRRAVTRVPATHHRHLRHKAR
ncbi:MAG TPA: PQQ-binding-like beta-propeller repeat protein [Gaiellaceae bacterium]|nr:PQQ-binding-like beta-propeller repeat protein [Gaiellaceae bacterium]